MSINRVMISGNLTRDAELRSTTGGTAVLNLGVAVNDRRKNQQTGEWEDYANFIDCVMFGTRADALAQYLQKGTKVAIEGKLATARGRASRARSAPSSRWPSTTSSSCPRAARAAAAVVRSRPRRPRISRAMTRSRSRNDERPGAVPSRPVRVM
jgi:single-stranded DNA-binding protein